MAAVVGLKDETILGICAEAEEGSQIVSPSNYNSPGQTVIAGNAAAVERAIDMCKVAGAKRAMLLQVSVPSHCALMRPVAEKLQGELKRVAITAPTIPVVQNVSGEVCGEPDKIRENLVRQIYEPVRWVDSVHTISKAGVQLVVECGPGKVLCGLIKRTEPELPCCGSDEPKALDYAIEEARN